ncbi:MAG: C-terminal binding protein [Lachnospiraceae bacterium]|nr:C-terminal binding protein [Lachnospiraceae bacterium]
MSKFKVYVTDGRHASYDIERECLAKIDAELKVLQCVTDEDIAGQCADADAILLDMAPMTEKAVAALKSCKIINRYGVGYDNVAVEACTKRGIQVTNVPDYCMEDVSDHALALLLSCLRDIPHRDRAVRQGEWNIQRTAFRLRGKTLGVLGFGRIARALVRKCSGFDLEKVLVYDPYVSEEACRALGATKCEMEDVLKNSDFISLHMPVTPETKGMIGEKALALVKPTVIIVNTGRGPLVDDAALTAALKEGRVLAAGLDTHNQEPLSADSPYKKLDNVILTDHTAYSTEEGVVELKTKSAENIVRALLGEPPIYPVNKL